MKIIPVVIVALSSLFLSSHCVVEQIGSPHYPTVEKQRAELHRKKSTAAPRLLDSAQMINDLAYLTNDETAGRRPGTEGHALAMQLVLKRMRQAGVDSFGQSLIQTFNGRSINGFTNGSNIIGWVKGSKHPEKYIVVSAHYDHLGKTNRGTYYGADDNASGTACLLALAKYFKANPHEYSIVFAAFDREEGGLEGAKNFVQTFTANHHVVFNVNMDMIARSDKNEIFATGVHHHPTFKSVIDAVQPKTNVVLLMGHDTGTRQEDWTHQSDHYAFHTKGIPFLYIGVEDHADYHQPTDTFDKINKNRYIENCNMIVQLIKQLNPLP